MPSFNAQQLSYKVQSGNSVVIMIGDQVVAFAQTSDQAVDFGTESLYGIGTAKPQEIQQLRFSPNITITAFVLTNQGIIALSYPSNLLSVLANNSFDLHVIDASGVPLLTYIGCVANGFSQNVPVNAIVTENITFQAMDVLDSTGQSILNGNFALQAVTDLALLGLGLTTVGA
jgi:hypothetical protein